jgi:hypothetical protein
VHLAVIYRDDLDAMLFQQSPCLGCCGVHDNAARLNLERIGRKQINLLPRAFDLLMSGEKPGPVRSQATIAAISGLIPTMFMTRVKL